MLENLYYVCHILVFDAVAAVTYNTSHPRQNGRIKFIHLYDSLKTPVRWVLILSFHISAWYSRLHHAGHPIQVERGAQLCGRVERSVSAAIQGAGPPAASHGDFSYDRYTAPMQHSTIYLIPPLNLTLLVYFNYRRTRMYSLKPEHFHQ